MPHLTRIPVTGLGIACIGVAFALAPSLVPTAGAARIDDCADVNPDIARAVSLFYDEAQFERALDATRNLDLTSLDPACRAEVRDLRAQIFVSMGNRENAVAEYRMLLEELPGFQPEPGGMTERGLLEEARATRPIVVTVSPGAIELRGDRDDGAVVQTITLTSVDGRPFTWSVEPPPLWLSVSPKSGTVTDGSATVRVTPGPGASDVAGAAAGALTFEIDGGRERRVPVTLVMPRKGGGTSPLKIAAIVVGVAGAGVGGYLLFKGDDETTDPPGTRVLLDEDPPPPPDRGVASWIWRWRF